MKKTAMQELIELLDVEIKQSPRIESRETLRRVKTKAAQLLKKEREQIEDAWLNGVGAWDSETEAEQYFDENYKK